MKKLLAVLALVASTAFGATLSPVQLLNPTGSTAGQAILSTGPSSAPAWGTVTLSGVTGTLAIGNGGTGAATQSAALANLLGSSLIPIANGGTNAASASGTALDNITGFSGTGFLTRTGAGAYAFQSSTNGITLGNIAQTAANTVLANATGSTANVAAFTMPSCSGSTNALGWTSGTGFACNASINAATLGGATFAAPGAIGGTTAAAGSFTTVSASSTITPSQTAGIVGTTTNNNANAGSVGEYLTNTTSATSLTTTVYANATSVSLTAGDWDVSCSARFNSSSATFTQTIVGVGTTSATLPAFGQFVNNLITYVANSNQVVASPTARISLASTTTTYCVATAAFSSGTATVDGFIRARRVR